MKLSKKLSITLLTLVLVTSSFFVAYPKLTNASGTAFIMPAQGTFTSGFQTPQRPDHNGIDIANTRGTNILASAGGTVANIITGCVEGNISCGGRYGNYIDIKHNIGGVNYLTRYAHLSSVNVAKGQNVTQGQIIGKMGNTGHSTGPHLHFEIHASGIPVNPMNYINNSTIPIENPLTINDIKPNLNLNTRLGVIRNFEPTVVRKGPGASFEINSDLGSNGHIYPKEQYLVSEYQNGWYKISTDGWVYSEHFIYRPTNSINMTITGQTGTIPTPTTQVTIQGVEIKPTLSLNQRLGVIRNFEATVIRTGPGTNYAINNNAGNNGYIRPGDQYLVSEYQNGWYRIAPDAWTSSEHNNFRPAIGIEIK